MDLLVLSLVYLVFSVVKALFRTCVGNFQALFCENFNLSLISLLEVGVKSVPPRKG
jgi:hypothetical protein